MKPVSYTHLDVYKRQGPKIVTEETKKAMKQILVDIQDGTFAKDWISENQTSCMHFRAMRKREASHQLEEVGRCV